ncbi:hypothetical protein HZH66_003972 [Vespula vulgaris]|uniref:Uncharacterized protein n=1 Tax=Vespula vulgaris TaxID=7454 RepID=A0A834KE27_VESVU|nr:hypothetical protein HZH66_003972 [Vespula vulgaris]
MFNRELESNCLLKSNILDFGFTATTLKIRSSSNSSGSSGSSVSSLQHDFDVTAILESSERDRSSAVGYGLARGAHSNIRPATPAPAPAPASATATWTDLRFAAGTLSRRRNCP